MNMSFYIGQSGLRAHSNDLNIAAQNITNANTTGYKTTTADFRELVYNEMDQNINKELADEKKILNGHGVKIENDSLQFSQGVLSMTQFQLDFALASKNCLFAVERNGEVQYTRDGTFDVSVEDDANYLVTSDGAYVLNNQGQKIQVPYEEGTTKIDLDGIKQQIGVFAFENPYGLQRVDGQSFVQTDISGEPQIATDNDYELIQGALERSNTSLAKEMSDVIVIQKAYQFSSKVVQTADEVEDIVNNLRK